MSPRQDKRDLLMSWEDRRQEERRGLAPSNAHQAQVRTRKEEEVL